MPSILSYLSPSHFPFSLPLCPSYFVLLFGLPTLLLFFFILYPSHSLRSLSCLFYFSSSTFSLLYLPTSLLPFNLFSPLLSFFLYHFANVSLSFSFFISLHRFYPFLSVFVLPWFIYLSCSHFVMFFLTYFLYLSLLFSLVAFLSFIFSWILSSLLLRLLHTYDVSKSISIRTSTCAPRWRKHMTQSSWFTRTFLVFMLILVSYASASLYFCFHFISFHYIFSVSCFVLFSVFFTPVSSLPLFSLLALPFFSFHLLIYRSHFCSPFFYNSAMEFSTVLSCLN